MYAPGLEALGRSRANEHVEGLFSFDVAVTWHYTSRLQLQSEKNQEVRGCTAKFVCERNPRRIRAIGASRRRDLAYRSIQHTTRLEDHLLHLMKTDKKALARIIAPRQMKVLLVKACVGHQ